MSGLSLITFPFRQRRALPGQCRHLSPSLSLFHFHYFICMCVCVCGKLIKSTALPRPALRRLQRNAHLLQDVLAPAHTHTKQIHIHTHVHRHRLCMYVCKPEQTKRGVHPENANVSNNKQTGRHFVYGQRKRGSECQERGNGTCTVAQSKLTTHALCSRCGLQNDLESV